MPTRTISSLERAFELARSGQCRSTAEIFQALRKEGHDPRMIVGPVLMRQMRELMREAARLRGS
jgi:hypothetical protein